MAKARKDYPLSLRMPEGDLSLIDRAAAQRGRSRTDFIREAAVRAAEDVLMEPGLIRLSPDAFEEFLQIVGGPGEPVPEMVQTFRRKAPWERE